MTEPVVEEVTKPRFAADEITEFLAYRIVEEAEEAGGWPESETRTYRLAELEGKRLIVTRHARVRFGGTRCHCCWTNEYDTPMWPCTTLKALAIPYCEHEDFREEWKLIDDEMP